MQLRILLPSRVFATVAGVSSIIAESHNGSFGLLPRRLDCVTALIPGILTYQAGSRTVYLAVDAGVLVKTGDNVMVSVRRAIEGSDLGDLHAAVKRQFLAVDEQERQVRAALARMESSFIAKLAGWQHVR